MPETEKTEFIPGKWKTVTAGKDLILLATGSMVRIGLQVSEILKESNTEAGVVNCSSIKPLDEEYLKKMDPRIPVITLEEDMTTGGFGEYVTEKCRMLGITEPAECIGVPDRFIAHGSHDRLLEDAGLAPEKIAERIRTVLGRTSR